MDAVPEKEPVGKNHNSLISEESPYLLQHAYNPVDWYPWGNEAFEKARKEDKPVFLSIGYSTCHWCHVMAHESFEDEKVAEMMNEAFVCIKVDREERPDIDGVYMLVCQLVSGSGGWPLTIIMTPDKQPFFAATYISKESRFGRLGLLELIPRIRESWLTQRNDLLLFSSRVHDALTHYSENVPGTSAPNEMTSQHAFEQLAGQFDTRNGGFGAAPKFPSPHTLLFLLRYWNRTGDGRALEMVEKTLQSMRWGGIYDHIGFGFHRYSTDERWLVPHFEKMLYDQGLLSIAYTEVFQATRNDDYARTAQEIFTYVLRDMKAPEGGFYSAEDADSEGEEGKFYTWTHKEIEQILTAEESTLFTKVFSIEKKGNFAEESTGSKTGQNILHCTKLLDEYASDMKISPVALKERLEEIRRKVFDHREKRVHPHKDDKLLTDWNGLMIAALAIGARTFDKPEYAEAARNAADFILSTNRAPDGRLLHRYRNGKAAIRAHLDDYAYIIWGLIELYETTFDVRFLQSALDGTHDMIELFWDKEHGGFYFTSGDGEKLLVRRKESYDGAIPSGNSVAMMNLIRLGRLTANPGFERKAAAIGTVFSTPVHQAPTAHTFLMNSVEFEIGPSYEIVIAGDSTAEDTLQKVQALRRRFIPNKVVLLRPLEKDSPDIDRFAGFVQTCSGIGGKAAVYVCQNHTCALPTTDTDTMIGMLTMQ